MAGTSDWVQEFAALLLSNEQEDWDRAFKLKLARMPARIFRYRAPTPYALQDLRDETIWLSAPDSFNDPFDSSLTVDALQPLATLLRNHLTTGGAPLPEEIVAKVLGSHDVITAMDDVFVAEVAKQVGDEQAVKAKNFFRKAIAKQGREMARRMSQALQRGLKVACFSETGTSLTLWSYYADCHRGFCVEYPIETLPKDDLRRRLLFPVVYAPARFTMTSLMEQMIAEPRPYPFFAILAAVHKAPDWTHEREWRLINPQGDDSSGISVQMPTPSGLFLGARMEAQYRRDVVTTAQARGIPLHEMALSDD